MARAVTIPRASLLQFMAFIPVLSDFRKRQRLYADFADRRGFLSESRDYDSHLLPPHVFPII